MKPDLYLFHFFKRTVIQFDNIWEFCWYITFGICCQYLYLYYTGHVLLQTETTQTYTKWSDNLLPVISMYTLLAVLYNMFWFQTFTKLETIDWYVQPGRMCFVSDSYMCVVRLSNVRMCSMFNNFQLQWPHQTSLYTRSRPYVHSRTEMLPTRMGRHSE